MKDHIELARLEKSKSELRIVFSLKQIKEICKKHTIKIIIEGKK